MFVKYQIKEIYDIQLKMNVYCASELFQVSNRNEKNFIHDGGKIKNYHYPFNFEFKKGIDAVNKDNKGEFYGSGIYLITFNDPNKYSDDCNNGIAPSVGIIKLLPNVLANIILI